MRTILFITALFMSTLLSAQKPVEIPLWPNGAPNTNGLTGDQEDLDAAVWPMSLIPPSRFIVRQSRTA